MGVNDLRSYGQRLLFYGSVGFRIFILLQFTEIIHYFPSICAFLSISSILCELLLIGTHNRAVMMYLRCNVWVTVRLRNNLF